MEPIIPDDSTKESPDKDRKASSKKRAKPSKTKAKKTAAKRGRPTDLTSKIAESLAYAVSVGATYREAAEAAGIEPNTLKQWRRRGKSADANPRFVELTSKLRNARSLAIVRVLTEFKEATKQDVRLLPKYLEELRAREHANRLSQIECLQIERLKKENKLLDLKIAAGGQDTVNVRALPTIAESSALAATIFGSNSALGVDNGQTPVRTDPVEE